MNEVINRPKLNLRWMDAPIESDKWTIIFFDKTGKSYHDPEDIFPTEKEALDHINYVTTGDDHLIAAADDSWEFDVQDYSHAFPIPVKE